MCESRLYLLQGGMKREFMSDVTRIEVSGEDLTCTDILGERKSIKGRIVEIDLVNHAITVLPL